MLMIWQWYSQEYVTSNTKTRLRLCVDIGNTRTKWAVFDEDALVYKDVFTADIEKKIKEIKERYSITSCMSSSTRKGAVVEQNILDEHFEHTVLSYKTPLPIQNGYKTPKTLGVDRIAGVVGARSIFGAENCLVVDAGTCMTYDFIQADGLYVGGNIAPGIQMRLKAMHHFTDGLPLVDMRLPDHWLGESTETAMQNGAMRGAILEIRSLIEAVTAQYHKVNVILTGGDALFFAELLNTEIFVSSNLVLTGLNEILKYNA